MAQSHIALQALAARQGEDIRAARCGGFFPPSPLPWGTAIELSELRQDRSADFSPLPAVLAGPERGGLKSALLNSMGVLPWGEGEPFSPRRTIQTRRLSTVRCALFPLPEGEGQGEGKRHGLPFPVSDHSRNCPAGRVLRQRRRFR